MIKVFMVVFRKLQARETSLSIEKVNTDLKHGQHQFSTKIYKPTEISCTVFKCN